MEQWHKRGVKLGNEVKYAVKVLKNARRLRSQAIKIWNKAKSLNMKPPTCPSCRDVTRLLINLNEGEENE